jgi:IclR family transcriptional regulator, acetate operon repressor
MPKRDASETPSIQSLGRGLSILEAVAESPEPVPLKRLTDLLGIDRSSVFRLANTLRRRRFLANPKGRKDYILGPSAWRLSRKYGQSTFIPLCHEHLRQLGIRTGETAHLAVREGGQALFIDHHASPDQVVAVSGQTGEFVPLYCTAHGKALIVDFDLADLRAAFGSAVLQARSRRTITSLEKLARALARARANGYTIDDGEYLEEVRCVAAPIRDQGGSVVASIGISAPSTRFPRGRWPVVARQVTDAARAISATLSA